MRKFISSCSSIKITKEMEPLIIKLIDHGLTCYVLKKLINLERLTIWSMYERLGMEPPIVIKKKTKKEINIILNKEEVKLLLNQIYEITSKIKYYNYPSHDKIKELYDLGFGQLKITKNLNTTIEFVKKVYKELNLDSLNYRKLVPHKLPLIFNRNCPRCKIIKSVNEFRKSYRKNNRLVYSSYCNDCIKEYSSVHGKIINKDPKYKLRKKISKRIAYMLKQNGSSKFGQSCLNYLEYSINDLKYHLESQFEEWMTWNNWGIYNPKTWNDNDQSTWTWQLDHIIPHSTFKYKSMEEDDFKACWALSNLRPLSSKQNLMDGVTKIRHK